VRKQPTARAHHLRNLDTWFANYPNAVHPNEQHFRDEDKRHDLFPINYEERPPLRSLMGRGPWLRALFRVRRPSRHGQGFTTLHSDTGLDRFTDAIILGLGLCFLIGPIWCLRVVANRMVRLGIITAFATAFTLLAWSATRRKPLEILIVTAVYTAVLIMSQRVADK